MVLRLALLILGWGVWTGALAAPERPTDAEQAGILEAARSAALNYSKSLPNFICTQVIRRSLDASGRNAWRQLDTLTLKLSYFEQKEEYQLLLVNNRPTTQDYRTLAGAVTEGEFGTALRAIFEPFSKTEFRWKNWTTVRKHRVAVFSYRVGQAHTQFHLGIQGSPRRSEGSNVPYHGDLYIEDVTHMVLRFTLEAEPPPGFPVQESASTMDYDFTSVGGTQYLLPMHAEIRMQAGRLRTRNDVEFQAYRKFASEAMVSFGPPVETVP